MSKPVEVARRLTPSSPDRAAGSAAFLRAYTRILVPLTDLSLDTVDSLTCLLVNQEIHHDKGNRIPLPPLLAAIRA